MRFETCGNIFISLPLHNEKIISIFVVLFLLIAWEVLYCAVGAVNTAQRS